jgi:hypothetical protein
MKRHYTDLREKHEMMETNPPGCGLGTNWMRVSSSSATNLMNFPINTIIGSTFFRLIYP